MTKTIVWFRQDLRLEDNPALNAACEKGEIIPLFILDDTDRELGGASKWWLHHSLTALGKSLGGLVLRRGEPLSILKSLLNETKVDGIYWNRGYEPHIVKRDTEIKSSLGDDGHDVKSFRGSVVREPWEIETGSGGPYKVYTPFWKANLAKGIPDPIAAPREIKLAYYDAESETLKDWNLLPSNPDWSDGWQDLWQPGEEGAMNRLKEFLREGIQDYGELRNRPDLPNVSRLSPHIHFGEVSPRQICKIAYEDADANAKYSGDVKKFVAEVGWRDFANHLLFHFPEIPTKNWKPAFDDYPWRESEADLKAWQKGMTGYPMVDAGMRELWHTGYMHNRIRMLVGSFLVKHLQLHWSHGEAWFWDTLCDADLANNTSSWQWISGSGADAAPYFRIFNPISQGPKFDPNGDYVRKWCPELSKLPNKLLHAPHEATSAELSKAGIELGKTYPKPMVDHKEAREAALSGYEAVKSAQAEKNT
jgi:deoxyribodipyrimidine photo-lyase